MLAHGRGATKNVVRGLAEELARRNFVVLNVNAYGMGMSEQQLFATEQLLEKCVRYLSVNVSVKQVFSLLETGPIPNKVKQRG